MKGTHRDMSLNGPWQSSEGKRSVYYCLVTPTPLPISESC